MADRLLKDSQQTIKLGENEYNLSPVNLNVLADIEDEFGYGLGDLGQAFEKKQASTMRTLLWILIKNNGVDGDISREQIGEHIDIRDVAGIAEKISELISNSMTE